MKLFQIREDDLSVLEALLPALLDRQAHLFNNADRVKARQMKQILSDVRWNYGPPTCVEVIDAGPEP